MNERIQELWSQAGGHYNSGNQHTWPEYTIDDPAKFAELIVAEVLAVQEKLIANGHNAWHLHSPTKKHFGVEE